MRLLLHSKQRQAVIASAMMLALTGCVKEKIDSGREGEVPLKLTLSIENAGEPDTKAPLMGPNFPAGTHNVGLVVSNSVSRTKPGYYNMLMSVTSDGKGNNTMKYYSSVDGKTEIKEITVDSKNGASVTAYYPRIEGLQNYSLIPFDLTTAAQKASQTDLLCSPRQTVTVDNAANVPLVFKHVYAMLEFQVTKKNNSAVPGGIKQISVNNKTGKTWVQNKGTMDARLGDITGTSAGSVVVDYADDVNKVEFGSYTTFRVMIPPFSGAYEDGDIEVTFIGLGEIAPKKLLIKKEHLTPVFGGAYAMKSGARYIFNLSYEPITPTILEYGVAPYDKVDMMDRGSTYVSYNSLYGTVAGGHNGSYIDEREGSGITIAKHEKPYHKFEIAKHDLSKSDGSFGFTWAEAQGTAQGDNLCAKTFGGAWRLPRAAEMYLMLKNQDALNVSGNGFIPIEMNYYKIYGYWTSMEWSATEGCYLNFEDGIQSYDKTEIYRVRCIREILSIPPPPIGNKTAANAAIGDFSFSDGSFGSGTATLSAAQQAACIGIVYWTGDPTTNDLALKRDYPGCTHGMIVSLTEVQSYWQHGRYDYNKTVNEWIIANATSFQPIFSDEGLTDPMNKIMGYNNTEAIIAFNDDWSANRNWPVDAVKAAETYRGKVYVPNESSPWFLPSVKELTLLCGLDNQDGNVMDHGYGTGNRDAMNAQLAKIAGATQIAADGYWSSSEYNLDGVWAVLFSNDGFTMMDDGSSQCYVRFVRAF